MVNKLLRSPHIPEEYYDKLLIHLATLKKMLAVMDEEIAEMLNLIGKSVETKPPSVW